MLFYYMTKCENIHYLSEYFVDVEENMMNFFIINIRAEFFFIIYKLQWYAVFTHNYNREIYRNLFLKMYTF